MNNNLCKQRVGYYALFLLILLTNNLYAIEKDPIIFSDKPLTERITHPDWFKDGFLELADDLSEANSNKRGLILYFNQAYCPYCKAFLINNWNKKDIMEYTRSHFDVVAINVLGNKVVTDFDKRQYSEKQFSMNHKTNFTPSLLFYSSKGKLELKISGYRPPYQFRAALEYVADEHYKKETFKKYLARANKAESFGKNTLNSHPLFQSPPYNLQRKKKSSKQAQLVIFERTKCHACDVLHAGPLQNPDINQLLKKFDVIQLEINSNRKLITPNGKQQTAQSWANSLELSYAPTLIFFNNSGKEIIRIDSVVGFYRLRGVLQYILSKDYIQYPNFQQWRQGKSK